MNLGLEIMGSPFIIRFFIRRFLDNTSEGTLNYGDSISLFITKKTLAQTIILLISFSCPIFLSFIIFVRRFLNQRHYFEKKMPPTNS